MPYIWDRFFHWDICTYIFRSIQPYQSSCGQDDAINLAVAWKAQSCVHVSSNWDDINIRSQIQHLASSPSTTGTDPETGWKLHQIFKTFMDQNIPWIQTLRIATYNKSVWQVRWHVFSAMHRQIRLFFHYGLLDPICKHASLHCGK